LDEQSADPDPGTRDDVIFAADELERIELVYALLRSLFDWVPGPKTSTGAIVARSAERGFAPTKQVPCPTCTDPCEPSGHREGCRCYGPGALKRGRSVIACARCGGGTCPVCDGSRAVKDAPCAACEGRGWKRGRGFLIVDRYEKKERSLNAPTIANATKVRRRCDRCGGHGRLSAYAAHKPAPSAPLCDLCMGSGHVDVDALLYMDEGDDQSSDEDPLFAAQARQDRRGSYRELRRALAWLEGIDGRRRRKLIQYICHDEGWALSNRTREWLDETVWLLQLAMPAQIRVPAPLRAGVGAQLEKRSLWRGRTNAHASKRAVRDDKIRALYQSGASTAQLAATHALDSRRIQQIVASTPAPSGGRA
jgi:hypothetical protein